MRIKKPDETIALPRATAEDILLAVLSGMLNIQHIETTTPLGAGVTFTGATRDCIHHSDFAVSVYADVAGTLYLENSMDGTTWRQYDEVSVLAGVAVNRVYSVTRRYNRVVYKNGATAQTVFELVTMLKVIG